jgi:membrane associated rhomboid family serine protease
MPSCLKCGAQLPVNEEGVAPVLCDRCAGRATSRARRGLRTGTLRDFPATSLLLAINLGVFLAMPLLGVNLFSPSGMGLVRMGGNFGPLTIGGEYWRLLTSAFVHDGVFHIAINMWCLWSLGRMAEHLFGKWQTLCVYLITALGGSLLSIAYDPERLSVGASGAIFGIAGALIAGLKFGDLSISWNERRSTLTSVGVFVVISLIWGAQSARTDNMCHLGGFVSGLLVGLPMGAFAKRHKLFQLATVLATAAVLFAAGRELVRTHGAEAQVYRAIRAMRQGDIAGAIPILEKYTAANPNDDEALVRLGAAYSLIGQREKAIAAYEQALKANPESEPARDALQTLREDNPSTK